MTKKFYALLPLIAAVSCSVKVLNQGTTIVQTSAAEKQILVSGTLFTSLFQKYAAEYKALCIQAYHVARLRVDKYYADGMSQPKAPKAIITDIDETILDNSPVAIAQALSGKGYEPKAWKQWTSKAAADTLCGALSFFRYAADKGIEIFYITNRDEDERTGTLKNLQKFHFPYADDEHLIMKSTTSSKESRRLRIAQTHEIVLLCGDNLTDFSTVFDKASTEHRNASVGTNTDLFGEKYILLPNPVYGDWLSSLYGYDYKLTPAQIDSVLLQKAKQE